MEKTETIVYVGVRKEVQMNHPYKQIFKQDEEVKVTPEMAEFLKDHPEYKETKIKVRGNKGKEEPKLEDMTEDEQRDFLKKKEEGMGWKQFQSWAKEKFGVSDTSKEELIEEIIKSLK